jgi:hypothetical protein
MDVQQKIDELHKLKDNHIQADERLKIAKEDLEDANKQCDEILGFHDIDKLEAELNSLRTTISEEEEVVKELLDASHS